MTESYSAEDPKQLARALLERERRLLLLGPPGVGKTTLAAALAGALAQSGRLVWCLEADPGTPAFGIPGALGLGEWTPQGWALRAMEAVCTLDAARFRLPLVEAAARLTRHAGAGSLLLDAPGVVRGVAGAELLESLVRAAAIDLVLVLLHEGHAPHQAHELAALSAEVAEVQAAPSARRLGKGSRDRSRTAQWDRHLHNGREHRVPLAGLHLLGTPPRHAPEAWLGRQVAFLGGGTGVATMGEVTGMEDETLQIRLPPGHTPTRVLLVRDAMRGENGLLVTGKRFAENIVRYLPPSDLVPDAMVKIPPGPRPMVQTGSAAAVLMNGVFGDPQLHLRLRHQRRSLLFDLGDGARLPARVAHQVSDIFISHAHMDHISGFLWLLRSRMGEFDPCRVYGPPGLATHLQHMTDGIHWDRIGDRGPRFEVTELHGDRVQRFALQAGRPGPRRVNDAPVPQGIVLDEPGFQVRATTLDHGIPVLAYAFEPFLQVNVRQERLRQRGLAPGPWLTELKQRIVAQQHTASISLPDGRRDTVAALAADLTLIRPGGKLVYATDFADTPDNRQRLIALADGAHTLFCEAPFLQEDAEPARLSGHLTTTACAEIANAAEVHHLIPFHFSRRYEARPGDVYAEIATLCPNVVLPHGQAPNEPD